MVRTLTIEGAPGTGKTAAAGAVVRSHIKAGRSVAIVSDCPNLMLDAYLDEATQGDPTPVSRRRGTRAEVFGGVLYSIDRWGVRCGFSRRSDVVVVDGWVDGDSHLLVESVEHRARWLVRVIRDPAPGREASA